MTIDEVTREIARTNARLKGLRSDLRYLRYIERLRSGKTISSLVYLALDALPHADPSRTPTQLMELIGRDGVPADTQYWAVESALRNMRGTGAVTKTGWGVYAATSRLVQPRPAQPERARAAGV